MAYRWPAGTGCTRLEGDGEHRSCPVCARSRHVCDHRSPPLWPCEGATPLVNRLGHGPDASGKRRGRPCSPEAAWSSSMPRGWLGWAGWCGLGQRRLARHWSVPPRRAACKDTHQSPWSDEALAHAMGLAHTMRAARQHEPARRAEDARDIEAWVLTLDGRQPAQGQATFSVVRALMRPRVGCAAPWLARATQEVQRLILLARPGAERLAKPGRGWRSDQPEAFVTALATEVPGIPPRDGPNPLLRAVAKAVRAMDSRAQVKRRRTGRGVRAIARGVLAARRHAAAPEPPPPHATSQAADGPLSARPAAAAPAPWASSDVGAGRTASAREAPGWAAAGEPGGEEAAGAGVLAYGAAVRGRLNDRQGGPLHPPGGRMSAACQDVRDALDGNLQAHKGGGESRG